MTLQYFFNEQRQRWVERLTAEVKSGGTLLLLEHNVERGVAVESLDLAVPHVEGVAHGMLTFAPVGWIMPAGVSIWPRKVP